MTIAVRAFAQDEADGLKLAARVRAAALALIAVWCLATVPWPRAAWYLAVLAAFLTTGTLQYAAARHRGVRLPLALLFPLLDAALLAALTILPLYPEPPPLPVRLRFQNELYFFAVLACSVFSYSPILVLWTGFSSAAAWSAAVWWVASQPGSIVVPAPSAQLGNVGLAERYRSLFDPATVSEMAWRLQTGLLIIVAGILAAAVWRARHVALRRLAAERARSNLARYVSPNLVDQLADDAADGPFDETRRQDAAVLFADIVGFTQMTAGLPPERAMALLRGFHRRAAEVVFAHGGTLDKYIGDAVMATFGTPRAGRNDATDALRCALALITAVGRWNEKRHARGAAPISIGVGLHYGPVVVGNTGDARRLELAVIGDTVNIASRLEHETRRLNVAIACSCDLVDGVRRDGIDLQILESFAEADAVTLRGRNTRTGVWVLRPALRSVSSETPERTPDAGPSVDDSPRTDQRLTGVGPG